MYLNAKANITIGGKTLQTVVGAQVREDAAHVGAFCDIHVPINCRYSYTNGSHDYLTSIPQLAFNVGDPVVVQAMYDGYPLLTLFQGFLSDFIEGMPMILKCNNFYPLMQGQTTTTIPNISLKNLLQLYVAAPTGITLVQPVFDLQLVNVTFTTISPYGILEWIKKELGLNLSLRNGQLYCNVASNTRNVIKLMTNRNVWEASLQQNYASYQTFKVKAFFVNENGTENVVEVGDPNGQCVDQFFYKVAGSDVTRLNMANEALNQVKQRHFKGSLKMPLYPEINLFDQVDFTYIRFPDQNGSYVASGIMVDLLPDEQYGFSRTLKLSYLNQQSAA